VSLWSDRQLQGDEFEGADVGSGPQAVYKDWLQHGAGPSLYLKLRALMSTDLRHLDAHGFSLDPELRWRLQAIAGRPAALTLSLQPTWASRPLHRYFYEVTAAEATATRPAFAARPGYLGTAVGDTLSDRAARNLSWLVTARVMSLEQGGGLASVRGGCGGAGVAGVPGAVNAVIEVRGPWRCRARLVWTRRACAKSA
jgi:hypothetical protein